MAETRSAVGGLATPSCSMPEAPCEHAAETPAFGASAASTADAFGHPPQFQYLLGRTSQAAPEGAHPGRATRPRAPRHSHEKLQVVAPDDFQPENSLRAEQSGPCVAGTAASSNDPVILEASGNVRSASEVRPDVPDTFLGAASSSLGATAFGATSLPPGASRTLGPSFGSQRPTIVYMSDSDVVLRMGHQVEWLHGTDTVERWLRSLE
ncbi:Uap1 [Symbiodinium sp. CCMP2592]|nr:Uap1 [Symbiodinium sp. CCMP2592]